MRSSSKYLIVTEKAGKNYSTFCPDLLGCIATGSTRKESKENMKEAILFHLKGLKKDGWRAPRRRNTF